MNILSIYKSFENIGGAQKMCIEISKGLEEMYNVNGIISSKTDYNKIHKRYKYLINKNEYLVFNTYTIIKKYSNYIILSHHRKITTLLILTSKLLNKKINLIHIAHNEFNNYRLFTLFPNKVIAVSKKVKKNHETYFGVKNIKVIYNGITKDSNSQKKIFNNQHIKIGYPARITNIKNQTFLIKKIRDHLNHTISIYFAGDGPNKKELIELTEQYERFYVLGNISNMKSFYQEMDFIMLYTKKEGLPLSLIESLSFGKPIICNDVGGNLEILNDTINGYLVKSIDELINKLNDLENLTEVEYNNLVINSLDHFDKNFTFKKMIKEYFIVINEIKNK